MTPVPPLPAKQFPIDRDSSRRDNPDLFDLLWADPATRVLAVHEGKVLLNLEPSATSASLNLHPVDAVTSAQFRVYLGLTTSDAVEPSGTPVVLAVLSTNGAHQLEPNPDAWHDVRKTRVSLSERDSTLYLQALALANFHQSHSHCARCGKPTMIQQGGWSRICLEDNRQTFPRTDPAIIVAVTDDEDRILLGSQGVWEANRWSVLAGFVEAGEDLVTTVIREVEEESGVHVHQVEYFSSQAWPFPNSLMIGFRAKLDPSFGNQELRPDGVEIVKVRWFSRDEVREGIANHSLVLPGPITIARRLIEDWFGGPYDD